MTGAVGVTSLPSARELTGDKAARIVEAMRTTVAERGIAGATFDQVARAAGVSRGLLHYYFGSKERLLIEAARRETEVRRQMLEQAMAGAASVEQVLDAMVGNFEDFLSESLAPALMFHELLSLAARNQEIADALAEMGELTRAHLAGQLSAKADAGVLKLRGEPEAVAAFLIVLADGITVRRLSEPELDIEPLLDNAVAAARALLS